MEEGRHFATVEVANVRRRVNVDLLQEDGIDVGDWVLIHVGFAMSKISKEQAEEQIRLLSMLGEDDAAMEEWRGYNSEGEDPVDTDRTSASATDDGQELDAGGEASR